MTHAEPVYDYFEKDNARFRRRRGGPASLVHEVFDRHSRTWSPYQGDYFTPTIFGDRCESPMGAPAEVTAPEPVK